MPYPIREFIAVLTMSCVAVVISATATRADQPADHHGEIKVDRIWATPGKAGERSILRFRVLNESGEHMHLLDVSSPVTKEARIVVRVSDNDTSTLDSIVIPSDSKIDLGSDHMWIELGPLTRAVEPGELISLDLVFLRNRIQAEAHVHSSDRWTYGVNND